jgi:hypothetical protein
MGVTNWFSQLASHDPLANKLNLPGAHGYANWQHPSGGTSGPYAGVAPSLAGANAGYGGTIQAGANPNAAASAVNPYAYAASKAAGS